MRVEGLLRISEGTVFNYLPIGLPVILKIIGFEAKTLVLLIGPCYTHPPGSKIFPYSLETYLNIMETY